MGMRVGIDLGTTFSAVAKIDSDTGKPNIIKNSFGSAITPSVLCFEPDGNILFGEDAKNLQLAGDANTIAFFKRSMGKDLFSVDFFGNSYTATDLSAILLKKLKEEAERQAGEKIDSAVITVPAYFTHKERAATIEAGRKAGLKVTAIINEPTAAAFSYGLNEKNTEQTVLIYDLGGGTFDVTLAKINNDEISILGSDGNHELGGKDWDDCIARYLASEFMEKYEVDLSDDPEMVTRLLVVAENVKKQLTSKDIVNVPIAYGSIQGMIEITEQTFEEISQFLINMTKDVIERLMESVQMEWSQIEGVILVGGSTRMRMVHDYVREMSGKDPLCGVNVDEAVALGAAIRANITAKGEDMSAFGGLFGNKQENSISLQGAKAVSDVTAHSLGMISISADGERYVNSIIIKKNTKIPARNTRSFNFRAGARENELEIYVLQGEFLSPLDNMIINKYVVCEIEKMAQHVSVIDVTYEYDSDGVIRVSAVQKETGKNLPVKIMPIPEDMGWTEASPKDVQESAKVKESAIFLTIDLSGSMRGTPLQKAKRAMKKFVDEMNSDYTKIGIIPFADSANCELLLTDDYCEVKRRIDELEIGDKYGIGNSSHPFKAAYSKLHDSSADVKYIIVLTDGLWSYADKAIAAAKKCHKAGIEIMAVGFGTADQSFLKKIASTDEFASLTDLSDLGGSFSKIAQVIGENSAKLLVL